MGVWKHCFPQCLGKLESHGNLEFYFSLLTAPLISKTKQEQKLTGVSPEIPNEIQAQMLLRFKGLLLFLF